MKILYVTRSDGTHPRNSKVCNSLLKLGHEVAFLGWDRKPETEKKTELDPRIRQFIYRREAGFGGGSFNGWLGFYHYFIQTLKQFRPDAVQAINEEKTLMALPFRHFYYRHLICEVYDSVICFRPKVWWYKPMAHLVRYVSNFAANRVVETGDQLQNMLGRFKAKSIVLYNSPLDPGPEMAAAVPSQDAVCLAVGGTLMRQRDSLETILKAADLLPRGAVKIMASGWLRDDYARDVFIKHPAVEYACLSSQREFHQRAAGCDAILYLCSDAVDNEYRSWVVPTRLFDAMAIGRPMIMGRIAKMAGWLEQQQLGYSCAHDSPEELAKLVIMLKKKRPELPEFARRTRKLFVEKYCWDVMEQRIHSLYTNLV